MEKSSFGAMRSKEKQTGIPGHDYDRKDQESLRMRRGKPGGYTDYLSQVEVARVLERCRSGLIPAGRMLMAEYDLFEEAGAPSLAR